MLVNNDDMCRCQGDHRRYVKDACKHTRQHEGTMMHELHGVVNRMDAVGVMQGLERASTVIAMFASMVFMFANPSVPWVAPASAVPRFAQVTGNSSSW